MRDVWTVFLSILRPVNQPITHYRNKMQKISRICQIHCLRVVSLPSDLLTVVADDVLLVAYLL